MLSDKVHELGALIALGSGMAIVAFLMKSLLSIFCVYMLSILFLMLIVLFIKFLFVVASTKDIRTSRFCFMSFC